MRSIPDDNLAYPVLISIGPGTGSGFFVNTDKASYLVTAKHVIYKDPNTLFASNITLTSYSDNLKDSTQNVISVDLKSFRGFAFHSSYDVIVFKICSILPDKTPDGKKTKVSFFPGINPIGFSVGGFMGVPREGIKLFEDVMIGNDTFIFGYPVSLGLANEPQMDYQRPLLRKGIVAGKNEKLKTLILDCPVYPGNSGGVVVEKETVGLEFHYKAIGVVTQLIPWLPDPINKPDHYGNSGYSVAVPMDFVLELIDQMEKAP